MSPKINLDIIEGVRNRHWWREKFGVVYDKSYKIFVVIRYYPRQVLKNPGLAPKFFRLILRFGLYAACQNAYDFLRSSGLVRRGGLINGFENFFAYDLHAKKCEIRGSLAKAGKDPLSKTGPKISIIVPVYDPSSDVLDKMIKSVVGQTYTNWELCLANAGTWPTIKKQICRWEESDARIKAVNLDGNGGISANSNAAARLASGEFIALLDHDDALCPNALSEVARLISGHEDADLIYSDEDKIDFEGNYCYPYFKPDWSPDMLLSMNYISHLTVYRKELFDRLGGFRSEFDGAQDYDLLLRVTEETDRIHHIPKVLYHWRMGMSSTAYSVDAKPESGPAARRALSEAISRQRLNARLADNPLPPYFVRYEPGNELVSIIIPTNGRPGLIEGCLTSIFSKTNYPNFEVVIVDNNSQNKKAQEYLREIDKIHPGKVTVVKYEPNYNWSAINNLGTRVARGDVLVYLNDDIEVLNSEWLTALVEQARRPEVGVVGCQLLYRDGTIQHAGVVWGFNEYGGPGHVFKGEIPDQTYFHFADVIRNYGMVTGACLAVRRAVFDELNGFDEKFVVPLNDIDFCLRARSKDYLVVYTPLAQLYHLESATLGIHKYTGEKELFLARWGELVKSPDPYYNLNLSRSDRSFLWRGY